MQAQDVSTLQQNLQLVASIGVLVGMVALPIVLFKLRDYFPDKDDTVSKVELEKRFHDWTLERQNTVGEQFATVRTEIQSTLLGHANTTLKQMDHIVDSLKEIRESTKESFRLASSANDRAKDAGHQAEMAHREISALDRLVMGELASFKLLLQESMEARRAGGAGK